MEIDDELATFLRPGPYSLIVVAVDGGLMPESTRGWGPRIREDGRSIDIFVGRKAAAKLIENLAENDAMAVAIANVTTYQALQMKGRCIEIGEPDPGDLRRVLAHNDGFAKGIKVVGLPETVSRGVLITDLVRLTFVPEMLFDQTPGPEAGVRR
jgi:hypothetical protein